jgi:hypothetical protein
MWFDLLWCLLEAATAARGVSGSPRAGCGGMSEQASWLD